MIKILIITNDSGTWADRVRNSLYNPICQIRKDEITIHNSFICVEIKHKIQLSDRGRKYHSIIFDAPTKIDEYQQAVLNTNGIITTPNYNKKYSEIFVDLNRVVDLKEFMKKVETVEGNVFASSNNSRVDAKSVMGMMSLDLTKPIKITFPKTTPIEIMQQFDSFTV